MFDTTNPGKEFSNNEHCARQYFDYNIADEILNIDTAGYCSGTSSEPVLPYKFCIALTLDLHDTGGGWFEFGKLQPYISLC